MSFLFGGAPPTTQELARRYKNQIDRAVRELDRENAKVAMQEAQLLTEIRRCASLNPKMATQKARSVVRTRKMQARFSNMKSHMQAVSCRISNVRSTEALQKAMAAAIGTMKRVSAGPQLASTLRDFERQCASMGMQNEMLDQQMEDVLDDEDDGEIDDVVVQVLLEAGVDSIPTASSHGLRIPNPPAEDSDDIRVRLNRLRQ